MHSVAESRNVALQRCPDLEIRVDTPKGRGVFATARIPAKTIIDVCPVLILGEEENRQHIAQTSLYHYTYNWPVTDNKGNRKVNQAVIFGLGSMFNHSTQEQNVVWERNLEDQFITYWTARDVLVGEELCISYGNHLTFKDTDASIPPPPETEIEQLIQIQLD